MRVLRIPFSTNVERVALALGHKGIPVEWVDVDPADRSPVRELSGQDLVPVLETDHGEVLTDSMRIVAWLENFRAAPPLWPAADPRRTEIDVFIEWFDRVWKVPPNAIEAELCRPEPDEARIAALAERMHGWLHWFEALLEDRDHLMGDAFSAADVCAFPFLKYGVLHDPDDDELFHRILMERLPIAGGRFPRLEAWVHRVDERPRS
ncbi:MAG TPA: glutathione S-transferase family protein [Solirubrobacteraceae bacterium]|nr:glutathione S-transferase family protein [Solirubrobacteraceae bacterium]